MEGSARDASLNVDTTLTFSAAKETVSLPYVWSYGMGAESTAAIHRMLTHPDARPTIIAPDFTNLAIVIAQTGDEWSTTGELVDIGKSGYHNLWNARGESLRQPPLR